MSGKVKDILKVKGNAVFSVSPDTTVYEAIEQMCERNIGGVIVKENEKMVGIFTERDYARKLILKGKSSKGTPIRDLMTPNPISVTPEATINECMGLMSGKRIRHLPVVSEDQVVGMISIGDVVRRIIEDQQSTIEHLESYISGAR
jgi:CBS domain-containing protein